MMIDALYREAHVWHIAPESVRDEAELQRLKTLLSQDELDRYHRLRFAEDRHLYLISHALLREALSKYARIPPANWRFSRGEHGRPEIANPKTPHLRFNLTHTAGLACCIVTLDDNCGIDAERITARRATFAIAKRMFSEPEYRQLRRLQGREQLEYFFTCWTLREAYVKATGTGIFFPTRKLTFTFRHDLPIPQDNIRIEFQPGICDHSGAWQLELLQLTSHHVTAIAIGRGIQHRKTIVARAFDFRNPAPIHNT